TGCTACWPRRSNGRGGRRRWRRSGAGPARRSRAWRATSRRRTARTWSAWRRGRTMRPERPTGPDPLADLAHRVREIGRENERLFERLSEEEHRFRGLARAVFRVQEDERRRLARELH